MNKLQIMESTKKYVCAICNQKFTRKNTLKNHTKVKHELVSLDFSCYLGKTKFRSQDKYLNHIGNHKEGLKFVLFKDVFDGTKKLIENT